MSNRLNEVILIIPGDSPTIQGIVKLSGIPQNLKGFSWIFAVFYKSTDLDSQAIFTVTTNSGNAVMGQANFEVSIQNSLLLIRGKTYWFRTKWTDPGGIPFTAWEGTVLTGSVDTREQFRTLKF